MAEEAFDNTCVKVEEGKRNEENKLSIAKSKLKIAQNIADQAPDQTKTEAITMYKLKKLKLVTGMGNLNSSGIVIGVSSVVGFGFCLGICYDHTIGLVLVLVLVFVLVFALVSAWLEISGILEGTL